RDFHVTGVQTCALPISAHPSGPPGPADAPLTAPPTTVPLGPPPHATRAVPVSRACGPPRRPGYRARTLALSEAQASVQVNTDLKIGRASCRESVRRALA